MDPEKGPHTSVPSLLDNQEFLVNSNCSVLLLLHYIRKKLGLRKTGKYFGEEQRLKVRSHKLTPASKLSSQQQKLSSHP